MKNNQIKLSLKNEFLNKLDNIRIGKETTEQKKVINNLEKFCKSRVKVINFFRDYIGMLSDANYNAIRNETKTKGLKVLTHKQMLQRLPIALAQVEAGKVY